MNYKVTWIAKYLCFVDLIEILYSHMLNLMQMSENSRFSL